MIVSVVVEPPVKRTNIETSASADGKSKRQRQKVDVGWVGGWVASYCVPFFRPSICAPRINVTEEVGAWGGLGKKTGLESMTTGACVYFKRTCSCPGKAVLGSLADLCATSGA